MKVAIFGSLYQERYIKRVASLLHRMNDVGVELSIEREFRDYLVACGAGLPPHSLIASPDFDADLAMSLGGDGTFLRTAQWVGAKKIPILGVNTGHLGYLASVSINDAFTMISNFIVGEAVKEERALIHVDARGIVETGLWPYALNEVAVLKEDTASMIAVDARINGTPLATYLADGLLVSTPTGSTGYNLSVGGPIVEPTATNWVITPVAAHTLTMRPLVVDDRSEIELTTTSRANEYRVSLDGRSITLPAGSHIRLRRASFTITLLLPKGHTFADTLRQKLMWGQPLVSR